jgi:hypothetical protein
MRDQNAQQLLARVMGWTENEDVLQHVPALQLLAEYKYDHYQQFGPGKRFIESLALWLEQFPPAERPIALNFVTERLLYFSDGEFTHLVQTAYPDLIVPERMRLVSEEQEIPEHRVSALAQHPRFGELKLKSLYLGLSDGARTNELRRAAYGEISNEQIWHAYELGEDKAVDMLDELRSSLKKAGLPQHAEAKFNIVWLLDDFSGSGNTYIRYDVGAGKFKGKIKKIYERLHKGDLVDTSHYEVYLLLYVATRKALDHIEYWAERFTSEKGHKPLQVRVLFPLEHDIGVNRSWRPDLKALLTNSAYYDARSSDKHIAVGGTESAQLGFAGCALPVVLSHNTPNNSVYALWGPANYSFFGLFPRVSRHREV